MVRALELKINVFMESLNIFFRYLKQKEYALLLFSKNGFDNENESCKRLYIILNFITNFSFKFD